MKSLQGLAAPTCKVVRNNGKVDAVKIAALFAQDKTPPAIAVMSVLSW